MLEHQINKYPLYFLSDQPVPTYMPLLSGILVLPYVLQPQNAVIIALHGKCLFLFSQVSHLIYLFLVYCGISDFFFFWVYFPLTWRTSFGIFLNTFLPETNLVHFLLPYKKVLLHLFLRKLSVDQNSQQTDGRWKPSMVL